MVVVYILYALKLKFWLGSISVLKYFLLRHRHYLATWHLFQIFICDG